MFSCLLRGSAASGMKITLPRLHLEKMSEQKQKLDFQTDKTNFDTEWKWNIVSERIEKRFETFCTVSIEQLIKDGPMN